jgi:nitroimidazol reductase NimA-like FMN-containing flavoprotein (pyridoxamine 5'-phosphate oxidase superfamily)
MSQFIPTERSKVRRKADRADYDRETIYRILDEAFVCQVGFVVDGMPFVVPTNYVRVGDKLFLHGSPASRLMKTLANGAPFCLSVTLLDGIVFAPTAMGHSVNYRSVVVMGKAEIVEGTAGETRGDAGFCGARDSRTMGGRAASEREGFEGDDGVGGAAGGSIRESANRICGR